MDKLGAPEGRPQALLAVFLLSLLAQHLKKGNCGGDRHAKSVKMSANKLLPWKDWHKQHVNTP